RCYLIMRKYEEAGKYALECLAIRSELLDYNKISSNQPYPFERYNNEIIYFSCLYDPYVLPENNIRVNHDLYDSYSDSDKRKELFFTTKTDGTIAYTGDYGKGSGASKFDGITTSEIFLIIAECAMRNGNSDEAKRIMSDLIKNRYETLPSIGNKDML